MQARDVGRAVVRGCLVAALSAGSLAIAPRVDASVWDLINVGSGYATLSMSSLEGAFFGLFVGLLATPLALVELSLEASPGASERGWKTGAALFALASVLVAAATLQAVYTAALASGRGALTATQLLARTVRSDDALGYGVACVAGAIPIAAVSTLRVRGAGTGVQVLTGAVAAMVVALPLLVLVGNSPDNMVPVRPLAAWIFASGVLLGPIASVADRIADRWALRGVAS